MTNRITDEQAEIERLRRENAALVERNLVLQAKVRGAAVAIESPPPGAGALVATVEWSRIQSVFSALLDVHADDPQEHAAAGCTLCSAALALHRAAVPPPGEASLDGSTWWAVVPAKGAPETAYRNRVDAVRFVRECGEAGDTIRPLSVPPLDEAGVLSDERIAAAWNATRPAHAVEETMGIGEWDDFTPHWQRRLSSFVRALSAAPGGDAAGEYNAHTRECKRCGWEYSDAVRPWPASDCMAGQALARALRAPAPAPKCPDCDDGTGPNDDYCGTCAGTCKAPAPVSAPAKCIACADGEHARCYGRKGGTPCPCECAPVSATDAPLAGNCKPGAHTPFCLDVAQASGGGFECVDGIDEDAPAAPGDERVTNRGLYHAPGCPGLIGGCLGCDPREKEAAPGDEARESRCAVCEERGPCRMVEWFLHAAWVCVDSAACQHRAAMKSPPPGFEGSGKGDEVREAAPTHDPFVARVSSSRWRAECLCGWTGTARGTKRAAGHDRDDHAEESAVLAGGESNKGE